VIVFVNNEKLSFLLSYVENSLSVEINDVLNDSASDPHFSAVYVTNLIKSLIFTIENCETYEMHFNDVKDCFKYLDYSDEEYEIFEKKRIIESEYYIGEQF
jgi:hypothetical protein